MYLLCRRVLLHYTRGSSPPPSVQFSMARPVQLSMAVDSRTAHASGFDPCTAITSGRMTSWRIGRTTVGR